MRLTAMDPVPRRAVGMSRALLGLYAGALAAGTHWPRLQFGDPEHPVDKMLHFVAFGCLAFFLWQARYVRSPWALLAIVTLWIPVDELTQAIPGLGRSYSWEDMLAGWLGAATTVLLVWAARPLASPIARLRRERFDGVVDLALSEPHRFMGLLASAAAGVSLGGPLAILIDRLDGNSMPFQAGIIGLLLGGFAGAFTFVLFAVGAMEERMQARRLCLGCGEAASAESRAEDEPCPACGRRPLLGQWYPMPGLAPRSIVLACLPPVLGGLATILLAVILLQLAASRVAGAAWVLTLNDWLRGPARGMEANFHIGFLAVVAAVTVDCCRRRIAVRLERGSQACLGCGHDLRATEVRRGIGRCGECGAGFVRVAERNP